MTNGNLYNVFQDRSTFKNAVFVFVIVSLEQVVSRLGITCENATLWLIVPPSVIFVVSCLRSTNVTLLFNCNTFFHIFIYTAKVVTNTVHISTYIHLLTIRHVPEFTFLACMQNAFKCYIAYLQYTMLLTCKHHLYYTSCLHYVSLHYTILHYNTLHYLLTYIAYNT